jgi:hypothetical protein
MKILKSTLCGFAFVITAFAVFAVIVWVYSGLNLGFSSGIHYDARLMVGAFPGVSLTAAAAIFTLGFLWRKRR